MRLVEAFSKPKCPGRLNEDGFVVRDDGSFAAVIDGATPKSRRLWDGKTSGRMAMETLRTAIEELDPEADLDNFAATAGEAFRAVYSASGVSMRTLECEPWERMAASVAVYSAARSEVWMVGDCRFAIDGRVYGHEKNVDRVLARARAEANGYLLRHGHSMDNLRRRDLGRELISADLRAQCLFQNRQSGLCEYSYCVVDGFPLSRGANLPTDARALRVAVPQGSEVILASDGYPRVMPTLGDSEQWLAGIVDADPLCIADNVQTKGVGEGCETYDDRTYVRLRC